MSIELRFGSEKHEKIVSALRARVQAAQTSAWNKGQDYAEAEDIFQAYIPETEVDAKRRAKREAGEPQYTTLEIPYSYATLMAAHTYWVSVFLGRDPVLQFAGRHGETEQQVMAVEAIMDYQTQVGGHLVPYFLWLLDVGKYGTGIVGCHWDEEIVQVASIEEEQVTYLGVPILGKTRKMKKTKRVRGYTGNRLYNVRPADFLFDPRVSLANFQKGEFAGRYVSIAWNDIVREAEAHRYYNLDELRKMKKRLAGAGSMARDTGSPRLNIPAVNGSGTTQPGSYIDDMSPGYVDAVELYVELIPKDWGLGSSTYPEKWVFTLAENSLVIESRPYEALHAKFPFAVLEYEMEAYGQFKRGMLELVKPLQDTMTWLVNSHYFNVRQMLNGQFLVDPSRVTLNDFKQDAPGRLLRVRPAGYGQDPRSMITQLQTVDVTQNHIRDAAGIGEMIQRVTGVTDNIMGMLNAGGRKTATEIRSSNTFGANRLKTQCEYFSAMGWAPLAQMLLQNTQQWMDMEMRVRLAGDTMDEKDPFITVDPNTITGAYDFLPVDGTMPIDRFAQVTMWTQLFAQMQKMPELAQQYDMSKIFAHVAQLGGLKNIKRFKVNLVPDEQALAGAQAGNLIPLGGNDGGSAGLASPRADGRGPQNSAGVPGAARFDGLGPTG